MTQLRFIDLFAGLGGFHYALAALGHECVFASEWNPELLDLYKENFPDAAAVAYGDIREAKHHVPPHDILCAGFPCQPFSKSGFQLGRRDTRGTLFDEVLWILERHRPRFVLLENVGNFERHDAGRTWATVEGALRDLGYHVYATLHCTSGGRGLISPHHLGFPQHRERFYCVATLEPLTGSLEPRFDTISVPTRQYLARGRARGHRCIAERNLQQYTGILQRRRDSAGGLLAPDRLTANHCQEEVVLGRARLQRVLEDFCPHRRGLPVSGVVLQDPIPHETC